jgi:hypothetical protein
MVGKKGEEGKSMGENDRAPKKVGGNERSPIKEFSQSDTSFEAWIRRKSSGRIL